VKTEDEQLLLHEASARVDEQPVGGVGHPNLVDKSALQRRQRKSLHDGMAF